MRKFVFLTAFIIGVVASQISMSNMVFAAISNQKIAAVIISEDSDFKDKRFTDMVKETFEKNNKKIQILSGSVPQDKYTNYWSEKNLDTLEEPMPTKSDLIDFVSYGGYGKVIYFIIKNNDITTTGYGGVYGGTVTRVSVKVSAYLVNREKIIKTSTFTREDSSHVHINSMKLTGTTLRSPSCQNP